MRERRQQRVLCHAHIAARKHLPGGVLGIRGVAEGEFRAVFLAGVLQQGRRPGRLSQQDG